MTPKEKNKFIAQNGIKILLENYSYSQSEILQKFDTLGISSSKASLSNLSNGNRPVGVRAMANLAKGIEEILKREQSLVFDVQEQNFVHLPDAPIRPIAKISVNLSDNTEKKIKGYVIHNGRIDVPKKVIFYQKATHEVIEIGLRLKQFTNYFKAKREDAYLDPIRNQLANGIDFKCYVINPEGNYAKRYFEDRAKIQLDEKNAFQEAPKILADLKKICLHLNREGYQGKVSLYQYDHFPYYHASIIDPETENGSLYLSAYLYGVARANAPVIEVTQRNNKKLFKRYWTSIKAIMQSSTITQLV